jgi:lambda family phage portal protein
MKNLTSKHIVDHRGLPMQKTGAVSFEAGSSTSHELTGWIPGLEHPDEEIGRARNLLTARTRDLSYNNAWVNGALQRHVDDAIGQQFQLSVRLDYKALNVTKKWAEEAAGTLEREFNSWSNDPRCICDVTETSNFVGLLRTAYTSRFKNGEALALTHFRNRPGTKFRTAIQLVSPDRLKNPLGQSNGKLQNGNYLRNGIEVDVRGKPVAYHISEQKPGVISFKSMRINRRTSWGRAKIIHHFERDEVESSRGVGFLKSVVSKLKMLDRYERAELEAALISALNPAFIKSPMEQTFLDPDAQESVSGYQQGRSEYHDKKKYRLNGVQIPQLYPGEDFVFNASTRPNTAFEQFTATVLRYVAAGTGQSYEQLTQDWSKTNYSSARAALLQAWKFLVARREAFITGFVNQIWALWLEDALSLGVIILPKGAVPFWENPAAWCQSKWIGPGRGWVDPVKEQSASRMRVEDGISTLRDECAEMGGRDWQEVVDQRARELKYMRDRGIASVQTGNANALLLFDEEAEDNGADAVASDRLTQFEVWAANIATRYPERAKALM